MEDMSSDSYRENAVALGKLLTDHKGIGVVVLDLSGLNAWTDYFVIATVTSSTHLGGLERHIKDFMAERDLARPQPQRKRGSDDEWNLIDLGPIVVHLMTARSREFYDLERLWVDAPVLWKSE